MTRRTLVLRSSVALLFVATGLALGTGGAGADGGDTSVSLTSVGMMPAQEAPPVSSSNAPTAMLVAGAVGIGTGVSLMTVAGKGRSRGRRGAVPVQLATAGAGSYR